MYGLTEYGATASPTGRWQHRMDCPLCGGQRNDVESDIWEFSGHWSPSLCLAPLPGAWPRDLCMLSLSLGSWRWLTEGLAHAWLPPPLPAASGASHWVKWKASFMRRKEVNWTRAPPAWLHFGEWPCKPMISKDSKNFQKFWSLAISFTGSVFSSGCLKVGCSFLCVWVCVWMYIQAFMQAVLGNSLLCTKVSCTMSEQLQWSEMSIVLGIRKPGFKC